jgi:Zn-finger nucleic acid-binding protein
VWMESKVFASLVKNRDQQARLETAAVAEITLDEPSSRGAASRGEDRGPGPRRTAREYVPCPDCRQLMNRKNFGNVSGVLVDVCKPHGVWFDTGELGRIIRFVMRGGLIATRQRELEEQKREAVDKRVNEIVLSRASEPLEPEFRAGWVSELLQVLFRFLQ